MSPLLSLSEIALITDVVGILELSLSESLSTVVEVMGVGLGHHELVVHQGSSSERDIRLVNLGHFLVSVGEGVGMAIRVQVGVDAVGSDLEGLGHLGHWNEVVLDDEL
jgi:hypothetical protein